MRNLWLCLGIAALMLGAGTAVAIQDDEREDREEAKSKKRPGAESVVARGLETLGRLQSDRHTSEDWLDVRPFARGLATILASEETETPLVIGIQGRWGKGKSSLVAMIEDELEAINAELTGLASMEQAGIQFRNTSTARR